MRFKHRQPNDKLPEINLIPMLNVMMGILAFFVMVTMMLTTEQGVQVQLPNDPKTNASPPANLPDPLLVKLDLQGISFKDQPVTQEQLKQQMQVHLASHAAGFVVLQADPEVPYEQVLQLLGEMKDVGGDRVSLAIDE